MSQPEPTVEIWTLIDFFLAGVMRHKQFMSRLFSLDAFRFTPENREQIGAVLADSA